MSKVWLVRVPEQSGGDAVWEWLDAARVESARPENDGDALVARGTLAACAADIAARRQPVIALLPAPCMLVAPVNLPVRQQRQLQQALPFLLEENLAADIDRFHVVAGARIDAARLQVLAIERDRLRGLLDILRAAGIDPEIVTGEALLLPLPASGATFLLDGADSLLAGTDGSALGFDEADAATLADGLVSGPVREVRVLVGSDGSVVAAGSIETAVAVRDDGDDAPSVVVDPQPRHRLEFMARALDAQPGRAPANFREGVFARTGSVSQSLGFDWRPLAWLAASWVVLALGYQLAVGISYSREARAAHDAQVALYRQVYPGSSNVPTPRRQMEGQIRSNAAAGASFPALVGRTSEALLALDAGGARYNPRNLGWDGTHGQLRIDIVARSFEDLEQLRQALEAKGLAVDIGAGVSQEGGYKARMNIGMSAVAADGLRNGGKSGSGAG